MEIYKLKVKKIENNNENTIIPTDFDFKDEKFDYTKHNKFDLKGLVKKLYHDDNDQNYTFLDRGENIEVYHLDETGSNVIGVEIFDKEDVKEFIKDTKYIMLNAEVEDFTLTEDVYKDIRDKVYYDEKYNILVITPRMKINNILGELKEDEILYIKEKD